MTRQEARDLQAALVLEQWDEGDVDVDVLFDIDPDGFWAFLDEDGAPVGGVSVIASTDSIATVSHFYVTPEARGQGVAQRCLAELLQIHAHRIHDDVTITTFTFGGSAEAASRWGFSSVQDEIRFVRAPGPAEPQAEETVILRAIDAPADAAAEASIVAFDALRIGRERSVLWHRWLRLAGALTVVAERQGALCGVGTIRPSALGYRVGPLLAEDPEVGGAVLRRLVAFASKEARVAMDVPAANPDASEVALAQGFTEEFRTVRLIWGRVPDVPWHEQYATAMLHLD